MNLRTDFDPNQVQMSIGDHLEDLRRRILLGLIGVIPAGLVCLIFGQRILAILCRPLVETLLKYDINPQLYTPQLADGFMVYIKISLITAAVIAGPWILYQLWQFVSAGLYPKERQYVTRYIPLSIILLISGMLFVYFIVLPWSLQFFIGFATNIPLPAMRTATGTSVTTQPTYIQATREDPQKPGDFQIWFNTSESRLKLFVGGKVRVIPFGADSLIQTQLNLPDYLDLVLQLLLTFGLAFQLPLVVMALVRIGIVEIDVLKAWRRYVYFGLSLLAAVLSPGDVVTATIALLIPLIFLYELGIFLARMGPKGEKSE